jgi:hypothetical protein
MDDLLSIIVTNDEFYGENPGAVPQRKDDLLHGFF